MKLHHGSVRAALLLSSIATICSAKAPEPEQLDPAHAQLQGTWKVVALEAEGIKAPESVVAVLKLIFKARTLTFEPAEPGFAQFTYKLDSTTKPSSFDLIPGAGPDAGQPKPGIYLLEGDTLKICFGGRERPKTFTTNSGSMEALYTLRRLRE